MNNVRVRAVAAVLASVVATLVFAWINDIARINMATTVVQLPAVEIIGKTPAVPAVIAEAAKKGAVR
jgi:hypothetical protein